MLLEVVCPRKLQKSFCSISGKKIIKNVRGFGKFLKFFFACQNDAPMPSYISGMKTCDFSHKRLEQTS